MWRFLTLASLILLADSAQAPCCLPDGSCTFVLVSQCLVAGGSPGPVGSDCTEPPCRACCLPQGGCTHVGNSADCAALGGLYYHANTSCASAGCAAAQACCLENASPPSPVACADVAPWRCDQLGGWSMGASSTCPEFGCFELPGEPGPPGGGGGVAPGGGGEGKGDDESPMLGGSGGGSGGGEGKGDDESPMLGGSGGGSQTIVESGGGEALPGEVYLDREYVYGPGYVDEFIAQFDRDSHAIFMLQDGNYNVVALVAGPGHPGGDDGQGNPQPLPTGTVLEQYTYEPYGNLVAAEMYYPHAMNRAGHQGLFFERFDGTFDDHTLFRVFQGTAFITGAKGLYYNRNRYYSPSLGRFTTRDPNETGIPLPVRAIKLGTPAEIHSIGINCNLLYSDSLQLYSYLSSNPISRLDPIGLFSLSDINVSSAIQSGLKGINAYSTADQAFNYFKMFASGVSHQQLLLAMAFDAATNLAGGKTFELVFERLKGISNGFRQGAVKGLLAVAKKHKHHLFPRAFENWFKRPPRNIDIEKYLLEIDEHSHLSGIHGRGTFVGPGGQPFPIDRWNDRWKEFIESNDSASAKEVYQYLGRLMDEYGLSKLFK